MFNSTPTREEFTALVDVVHARGDVVELLGKQAEAIQDVLAVVRDIAKQAQSEAHMLKAMVGALIAELAGRSDDPFRELADILRRARFAAQESMIGDVETDHLIQNAQAMVCEIAETYLRRGEESARS